MCAAPLERREDVDDSVAALFSLPQVKIGPRQSRIHVVPPSRALNRHDKQYEFEIPILDENAFVDLKNIKLYLRGQMEHHDGTKTTKEEKISMVNSMQSSLFSTIRLFVGNNQMEIFENNSHYRAYIKQLWKVETVDDAYLTNIGFYLDWSSDGDLDNMDRSGAMFRRTILVESKEVELYGKLMGDFFNTEGYLLPGCPLKIVLQRSDPDFYLLTTEADKEYRFIITDLALHVPAIDIDPTVTEQIQLSLETTPATYNYDGMVIKTFSVEQGTSAKTFRSVFEGLLPRKVCLAMVRQTAYA
jgi:hypothetical protein